MISFMSKFEDDFRSQRETAKFEYIKAFIFQRVQETQENPEKYSYKDFETINRMVKMMTDIHNEDFYCENLSRHHKAYLETLCNVHLFVFKLENSENIEKYMNLPIINFSDFFINFNEISADKYHTFSKIFESIFQK